MAFRDLLGAASIVDEPTSILHGVFDKSKSTGHDLLVFENLIDAPGHRIAVNLLTRPRLCAALSIEPEEFIDLLGWAMVNPKEPKLVEYGPVFENILNVFDFSGARKKLPDMAPNGAGKFFFRLIQTLPTFWAT